MARQLRVIAREIAEDWKTGPSFNAAPYLSAMSRLGTMDDSIGHDDAESIILYFLSNAQAWRGPVARRVKAELKEMCK